MFLKIILKRIIQCDLAMKKTTQWTSQKMLNVKLETEILTGWIAEIYHILDHVFVLGSDMLWLYGVLRFYV